MPASSLRALSFCDVYLIIALACSCSVAERSIWQCVSKPLVEGQKISCPFNIRRDFEPIGISVPHHYVVCVNYSWHQGKFYPGMVCGKTRDFGVTKDWAQILVL